jgi:hypothetical protein
VIYKFSAQTDSIYGRLFHINNETGEIAVRQPLDREQNPVIQLTVLAHDLGPDSLPSDVSVIVNVDDVNDNSPSIVVSTLPLSASAAAASSPSSVVVAGGRRRTQVSLSCSRREDQLRCYCFQFFSWQIRSNIVSLLRKVVRAGSHS